MTRSIVIDTDAGWDDWLALLYIMKVPGLQILGITVTGAGEAHLIPSRPAQIHPVDQAAVEGDPGEGGAEELAAGQRRLGDRHPDPPAARQLAAEESHRPEPAVPPGRPLELRPGQGHRLQIGVEQPDPRGMHTGEGRPPQPDAVQLPVRFPDRAGRTRIDGHGHLAEQSPDVRDP